MFLIPFLSKIMVKGILLSWQPKIEIGNWSIRVESRKANYFSLAKVYSSFNVHILRRNLNFSYVFSLPIVRFRMFSYSCIPYELLNKWITSPFFLYLRNVLYFHFDNWAFAPFVQESILVTSVFFKMYFMKAQNPTCETQGFFQR